MTQLARINSRIGEKARNPVLSLFSWHLKRKGPIDGLTQSPDHFLLECSEDLDERELGYVELTLFAISPIFYASLMMVYKDLLLGNILPTDHLIATLPLIILAYVTICTLEVGVVEVMQESS